jgi:glycosyltransferase involved in cell wall biosynthesis
MESHLKTLCDALKDRVDITVLAASESRMTTESTVDGVRVIRVGTVAKIAAAPLSPALPLYIRRNPADVIHIHMPHPAAIPAYYAAARGTPLVITYHSDIVRQRLLGKMFGPILERALGRASIICTSAQYRDSSPFLRRHAERCHIIPLAVRPNDFARPDPDSVVAIRERYGPKILLAVGRLVYYKGYEYLIKGMRNVEAALLIVGEGPLRASLEELARLQGVADRVHFLGEVKDIAPHYHAADVFVLPSIARSEAFGIVQLEAMSCGTPVVNTSLDTGVPFVSLHGVTGLTVPPADSDALAGAINVLLDRPQLRASMGAAARHRVLAHFTVATMADATLALLQQAAHMQPKVRETLAHAVAR